MNPVFFAWVVTGDTYLIRDELRKRNFRWDPDEKVWWRDYLATDLEGNLELRKWARTNELTLTQENRAKFGKRRYSFEGLKQWR